MKRAKLVKESLNEYSNAPSLFVEMYKQMVGNPADFSDYTVKDAYGPNGDMHDVYDEGELDWFQNHPEIYDWGTWNIHSEESEYGLYDEETDEENYIDFENALLEAGNFKQIHPQLFIDMKNKTGYFIDEYQNPYTPEYYTWFFAT